METQYKALLDLNILKDDGTLIIVQKGKLIDPATLTPQQLANPQVFKVVDPNEPWSPENGEAMYVARLEGNGVDWNSEDTSIETFDENNHFHLALRDGGRCFKTMTARRNAINKISDILLQSPKDTPDK